jgi:hypothetical protein
MVQACITNISFPADLDGVRAMGDKWHEHDWMTDLDMLIKFSIQSPATSDRSPIYWSAPKWLTQGDVLFFYHAVSAQPRIARLLKEAKQTSPRGKLARLLEHAANLADRYSGKILGCAQVLGSTEYFKNEPESHFQGRLYAP